MKVTVTRLDTSDIFVLEVNEDMELENFKALCEFETSIPAREIAVVWNGRPLHENKRKLMEYGVKDGEILLLQRIQGVQGQSASGRQVSGSRTGLPVIDFGSIAMPGGSGTNQPSSRGRDPDSPAALREMFLANPHDLALLKERNPPLAEALLSGDLQKFTEVLNKQRKELQDREQQRIRMLNADQFDPEVQNQIAEEIRLKNVETNMETAMEFSPESFGQVVMLYIDCTVNGQPVKAFVDSGAQMTIMSKACAERCGIQRLVDTRWAGIAKGVGVQKIIGRVHLCQIQIGPDFLQTSFSILEEQPMDMLLGLDMLKRHQCSLDLKRNVLVIGTTGTETKFLAEGDLPEHARLNQTASSDQMDEDRQLAEALSRSAGEAASSHGAPNTSAASSSATPTSSAGLSNPKPPSFPESDISRLTAYGFPRHQVLEELQKAKGNVDQALAALFAKSLQGPK